MYFSSKSGENKRKIKKTVAISLIVLTVIATFFKIRVGLDNDEVFIIYLASRLSEGKILFKDSWDVYGTASVIPALLIKAYTSILHTTDGLFYFLRTMSVIIQFLVAILAYFILKRHYSREAAFSASLIIANFLPRATQNFEYGFSTIIFFLIMSLLLLDVFSGGNHDQIKICIAGISYGIAVFVYPTMLITFPHIVYILLLKSSAEKSKRLKYSGIFWGGCCFLFLIFMGYILMHMTLSEFIINIQGLLEGGDHAGLFHAFSDTGTAIKFIIRPLTLLLAAFFLYIPIRIRTKASPVLIPYIYMIVVSMVIIGLNLFEIRPSGPFGLLERYIVYAAMSVLFTRLILKDRSLYYCLCIIGILTYLGALAASNLGFGENAMYSEPAIIAFVISAVEYMQKSQKRNPSGFMQFCIVMMLLEIIFTKGYFVRINGTSPANITEQRIVSETGITKNIILYPEQIEDWAARKKFIESNTVPDATYVNISSDTMLNYYYIGEIMAPQYAGTFSTGKQWVDYYSKGKRRLPDYIYIDKRDFADLASFWDTEFGKYIDNKYIEISDIKSYFYIIELK